MKIPETIIDNIKKESFQSFLKEMRVPFTGNKPELVERIENIIKSEIKLVEFKSFLESELKYGKNKQLFYCHLDIKNQTLLKNTHHIQQQLALNDIPRSSFNNLIKEDPTDNEVLFLRIEQSSITKSNIGLIELCIYKEIESNGESLLSNYVWIQINVDHNYMLTRVRPQQNMINFYTTRSLFEEISHKIQNIFEISLKVSMINSKETLYKMYKDFILTAEQPYNEIIEAISDDIIESQKSVLEKLNIEEHSDTAISINTKYKKLLEKVLLLNDLENYTEATTERTALVERLSTSDKTGGSANILPGDEDGLEVTTIYNDVRDTIDEIKLLNKLWVKWFYRKQIFDPQLDMFEDEKIEILQYKTRIEVFNQYVILTFLKDHYVEKEVQDFVFRTFREFENPQLSRSRHSNASMVAGNT